MDGNSKLSDKEMALIAAAKRELAVGRDTAKAAGLSQAPPPVSRQDTPAVPAAVVPPRHKSAAPAAAMPPVPADAGAALAERMAQLMAEESAQHRRRHKTLQLYLVTIPFAVIVLCLLWILFKSLPRLR